MIMIDLNVILDVVQKREPHYSASAALLSRVIETELAAYLPGHAVTTLHYIVAKYSTKTQADELVDWLLRYFDIAAEGKAEFRRARSLPVHDFEDAVVASAAESMGCKHVITRNVSDFTRSPVIAITPEEFLSGSTG